MSDAADHHDCDSTGPLFEPFLDQHLMLWDRACEASRTGRGLAHEALAQAIPLGWRGSLLMASIPFAALGIPAALVPATRALREAFGLPGLNLVMRSRGLDSDHSASWAEREASRSRAESAKSFALFEVEEFLVAMANCFDARYDLGSYMPIVLPQKKS
jgi:hypothetical protein